MNRCKHCKEDIELEWTEMHYQGSDTFARLRCPVCEEGCYLTAEIDGVEKEYRCCHCQN